MTYSSNLNRSGVGVQGDVPMGYKFGWLPDHGLQHSDNIGTNTGQWNYTRNLSIRSGLQSFNKSKYQSKLCSGTWNQSKWWNRFGSAFTIK